MEKDILTHVEETINESCKHEHNIVVYQVQLRDIFPEASNKMVNLC